MSRSRFFGSIAGVGLTSGVRVVVGRWRESPLGSFGDAMVETASGRRILLAPRPEVAEFIAATYTFDEVRIEPVEVTDSWEFSSPSLTLGLTVGGRTRLGWLLRVVPRPVARSPAWCSLTDPVSRVVLHGVRTRGTAGNGRREWYGATDHHRILSLSGSFEGDDLGELAPVLPAPRFGFSSTPPTPSVTTVVTTVAED